jgi:hypothetical protein
VALSKRLAWAAFFLFALSLALPAYGSTPGKPDAGPMPGFACFLMGLLGVFVVPSMEARLIPRLLLLEWSFVAGVATALTPLTFKMHREARLTAMLISASGLAIAPFVPVLMDERPGPVPQIGYYVWCASFLVNAGAAWFTYREKDA